VLLVQVKSGTLVLPSVPKVAEQAVLRKLAKTYGKTWHFWQFDRGDKLPLGKPNSAPQAESREGHAKSWRFQEVGPSANLPAVYARELLDLQFQEGRGVCLLGK
jgi:hypothetical protein